MRVKDTIPLRLPVETSETPPTPMGEGGGGPLPPYLPEISRGLARNLRRRTWFPGVVI